MARERSMVPAAEFRSYYGRQILKTPVWRHDIPAYLFTGGLAAGCALLAAGADLTGRPATRRAGRLTALGAVGASSYFLVNDLGRPERFHHMLRVVKPTSPMSMGTWILAVFGPAAGAAAASELTGIAPAAGRAAGLAAAGLAPALATYTAVLLADTAVPSWHEAYPHLPFVFAGSALSSAAGVGLLAAPGHESGPARRLAVGGAAVEFAASRQIRHRLGLVGEPYRTGNAGRLLRAGEILTAAGVAGALLGRGLLRGRPGGRAVSALSGAALLAGSALTRFGIFAGGVASTKDPRYTVVPQRERLARAAPGDPDPEGLPHEDRGAAGAGGDQLTDDRVSRKLAGDQEPA
jgi:Polysulphide reductase, NrfD